MKDLLKKFENKEPEIVFNWKDPETEAEGWTVINSLRGGAAGGGTRMRKGLDMNEVLSLAKTMEVKFSVSGPAIGGAKSGINFDPSDPRKKGVLERWYKAVSPLLKNYYGTGGDLNVDEIHEVIPMTEDCGVWHPQEGVFTGHFKPTEADKINRIGQLRQGVIKVIENPNFSPDVNRKYTVADMITGYGVAEAVRHFYDIYGGDVKGKKAIVPICNRVIPIIEDEYVDIEFGTGCLKVTPAHDVNDKELGNKHNLEIIDIFNEDACLYKFLASSITFIGIPLLIVLAVILSKTFHKVLSS